MSIFDNYTDILVLSGAGFGIDAGLPDYNDMHRMVDESSCYEYISNKRVTRRIQNSKKTNRKEKFICNHIKY